MSEQQVHTLRQLVVGKPADAALAEIANAYPGQVVFSTSFGLEDQVIAHLIFSIGLPIRVFTLDTGRIFPETYAVWNSTRERYNKEIVSYSPQAEAIQKLVAAKGPNSFYESVDNRLECCHIRKVEPLRRALKGNRIWITGIRKEQSPSRQGLEQVEWDEKNNILKFHPIFEWTTGDVRKFIVKNNIPYNPLHDKGYPSIGCQPCTRAVKDGEDPRAGRWWWESNSKQECGLHVK